MTGVFYDLPGSAEDRRSMRQPDLRHQWWAGTHYTGSAPARSSCINKLPPANVEKCPIPFSINEILRCGVKVSWLGIFCISRGGIFAKVETWIYHFLPLWTKTCIPSRVQSSTFVQPVYVRSECWKPTQNFQRHIKMYTSKVKVLIDLFFGEEFTSLH